ncbi:MAG: SDR family oxidoreductase, partial [Pseudomonadales bacterium]|nr:SDR family oxidoreductase [Pseudomonadales bacterium]
MGSLSGEVAAVTGASSGIGRYIAETLGAEGMHVFMCGRTEDSMLASKERIESAGGGATIQTFDINDEQALRGFVEAAANHAGRLDLMVNNAGLGYNEEPIADADPAHWREMLDVNVYSLLVGCQAAIRAMRASGQPGRIVNVSSNAAHNRTSGVYGATKHAVNVITATLRDELQDDDIRVTSLMPGVFQSNFIRNLNPETIKAIGQMVGMDIDFKPGDRLP